MPSLIELPAAIQLLQHRIHAQSAPQGKAVSNGPQSLERR
jgi:hypothetical protein